MQHVDAVRAAAAAGDNKYLAAWKHGRDYDPQVADAADPDTGRRPLHEAAEGGHFAAVVFFLKCGVTVDARDEAQCTPLYLAVTTQHVRVVNALLMAGADPRIPDARGRTCIDVAGASPSMRSLLIRSCEDVQTSPTRLQDFLDALSRVEAFEAEQAGQGNGHVHTHPVSNANANTNTPSAVAGGAAGTPTKAPTHLPPVPQRRSPGPSVAPLQPMPATTDAVPTPVDRRQRLPSPVLAAVSPPKATGAVRTTTPRTGAAKTASSVALSGSLPPQLPLIDDSSASFMQLTATLPEGCPGQCREVLLPVVRDLQEQTRTLRSQLEAVSNVLRSQSRQNAELKEQVVTLSRCVLDHVGSRRPPPPGVAVALDTQARGVGDDEWREVEWPQQAPVVSATNGGGKGAIGKPIDASPAPGAPVPVGITTSAGSLQCDQRLAGTEREELERELSRLKYERVLAPSPLKDEILEQQRLQHQQMQLQGHPHAQNQATPTAYPLPVAPRAAVPRSAPSAQVCPDDVDDEHDDSGDYEPSHPPGVWTLERRIAARQAEIESVKGGVQADVVQAEIEAQRREKERALLNEAIAAAELSSDKELAAHVKRCQSRERRHEELKSIREEQLSKITDLKAVAISHHADPKRRDEIKRQFEAEKDRLTQKYPEQTWEGTIDQQTALLLSRMSAEIEEAEKREAALNPRPPPQTRPPAEDARPASSHSQHGDGPSGPRRTAPRHSDVYASNSSSHAGDGVDAAARPAAGTPVKALSKRDSGHNSNATSNANSAQTTPKRHGHPHPHDNTVETVIMPPVCGEHKHSLVACGGGACGCGAGAAPAPSPSPSKDASSNHNSAKVFLTRRERERLAGGGGGLPPVGSPSVMQQHAA